MTSNQESNMAEDPPVHGDPDQISLMQILNECSTVVQEYQKHHSLFAAALEELQEQLSSLEELDADKSQAVKSDVLNKVLEKVPSAEFKAYMEGKQPNAKPNPELAREIDDNLRYIPLLAKDMQLSVNKFIGLVQDVEQHLNKTINPASGAADVDEQCVIVAALYDGMNKDTEVVQKVADAVSLDMPLDELETYVMLVTMQPHVSDLLVNKLLWWQTEEAKTASRLAQPVE